MADVTLRPATDEDCIALAQTMRQEDRDEIAITAGGSTLDALRLSLARSSHAVTAVDGVGRVICMFGVGSMGFLSIAGSPWLLGSDLVNDHWRLFVRLSRKYLAAILDLYPELENAVDARADRSVRWLASLGFTVDRPEPIGLGGAPMRRFHIERGVPRAVDALYIRPFRANDLRTIEGSAVFERPAELMTDEVLSAVERLPSFTAEVDGRIVGCAGLVPRDGGHEVWAYFAPRARMLPLFNACRRFLDGCKGPVWALVDQPSERWAGLLRFKPTGETRAVAGGRVLPIYVRV